MAEKKRQYSRALAQKRCLEAIERAILINKSEAERPFVFQVQELVVFGPLVDTDAPTVHGVDILATTARHYRYRNRDEGFHSDSEDFINKHAPFSICSWRFREEFPEKDMLILEQKGIVYRPTQRSDGFYVTYGLHPWAETMTKYAMMYQKLVRDNIPAIIEKNGETCVTRTLSDKEYEDALTNKLQEEVAELLEAYTAKERSALDCAEEIADVLEVLYAMGKACAVSKRDIEHVRSQKAAEKGTFSKKIFLVSTEK